VLRKTGNAEVARALQAQKTCEAEHGLLPTPSTGSHPDMTSGHTYYKDLASQRHDRDEYRQDHAEAHRAYLIGKAVRDRRLALGLAQTQLATRAGMTQPAPSRLEAGGVIPTSPLRPRLPLMVPLRVRDAGSDGLADE
jgi:ribosome-binding protein aMBF1 (putative translation factor)